MINFFCLFFLWIHLLFFLPAVGSSVSALSGLYTTAMKAAGASRRVFQLLDRASSMPKSGNKCPFGLVITTFISESYDPY